jgi:hypothetical protein
MKVLLPYEIAAHKSNDFSRTVRVLRKAAAAGRPGRGTDAGSATVRSKTCTLRHIMAINKFYHNIRIVLSVRRAAGSGQWVVGRMRNRAMG